MRASRQFGRVHTRLNSRTRTPQFASCVRTRVSNEVTEATESTEVSESSVNTESSEVHARIEARARTWKRARVEAGPGGLHACICLIYLPRHKILFPGVTDFTSSTKSSTSILPSYYPDIIAEYL
jgi:hypothetical protein